MNAYFDTFGTPFGPFTVAVNDDGAVIATAFGDRSALGRRLRRCHLTDDKVRTRAAREQVLAYAAGRRRVKPRFRLGHHAPSTLPRPDPRSRSGARIPLSATGAGVDQRRARS